MFTNIRRAIAVALVSSFACMAQAQDETNLVQSLTIGVKPGMNQQFEEAARAVTHAARETGSTNY